MRRVTAWICVLGLWAGTALAQSPVELTIDTRTPGPVIPDDFMGLSFGMKALPGNREGAYLFSATNSPLATLFQNLGLRHLRVGGTTVESPPSTPIPNETAIDNLFAFAKAAGVKKIIYSLRLLQTNEDCHYDATNAALARYIWAHYQPQLQCFAIGNEPDLQRVFKQDYVIRNFATYMDQWRKFAAAITKAVPEAKFTGPDGGSGNLKWAAQFAKAEKGSGLVTEIALHYYAGGKGKGVSAADGIDTMLSPAWLNNYESLHKKIAEMVAADGVPYRFTEANDHYSGGITNASDTFAGALWALDYLHWWAEHDAQGVDFHNTQWVVSDILAPDKNGGFRINPKAYGLKAFDLGAHGRAEPVRISNEKKLNLTAYAVGGAKDLFVTIINKEHGSNARDAEVTIVSPQTGQSAEAIYLTAPNGDVTTKTGVTLGRATITDNAPWLGKWTPLAVDKAGQCAVKVAAGSAAVIKISTE